MTRADLFVNFTYGVNLLAPFLAWAGIRLAQQQKHEQHRRVQAAVLGLCWVAVLVLEVRIRLEGGSGSFISKAPAHLLSWARLLLLVHIGFAVLSYSFWTWMALASSRKYRSALPGAFSNRHRMLGRMVLVALCINAATATGMYLLAFVL